MNDKARTKLVICALQSALSFNTWKRRTGTRIRLSLIQVHTATFDTVDFRTNERNERKDLMKKSQENKGYKTTHTHTQTSNINCKLYMLMIFRCSSNRRGDTIDVVNSCRLTFCERKSVSLFAIISFISIPFPFIHHSLPHHMPRVLPPLSPFISLFLSFYTAPLHPSYTAGRSRPPKSQILPNVYGKYDRFDCIYFIVHLYLAWGRNNYLTD